RVLQRADYHIVTPLTLVQTSKTLLAGPRDELELVDVIGPRETHPLLSIGRDLQAVHCKIEVATLEAAKQAAKLVLPELDAPTKCAAECLREIHFVTDVLPGVLGVFEYVRRATLGIGSPQEWFFVRPYHGPRNGEHGNGTDAADLRTDLLHFTCTYFGIFFKVMVSSTQKEQRASCTIGSLAQYALFQ